LDNSINYRINNGSMENSWKNTNQGLSMLQLPLGKRKQLIRNEVPKGIRIEETKVRKSLLSFHE